MGSDRTADHPVLSDIESQIRNVAQAVSQSSTTYAEQVHPYGGGAGGAGGAVPKYSKANIRPSVDDLEAIVDTKEQAVAEAAWDDPAELKVQSFIHRAWALEINRQGWSIGEISSDHIKALRMAQAAIRLIPKREPIA